MALCMVDITCTVKFHPKGTMPSQVQHCFRGLTLHSVSPPMQIAIYYVVPKVFKKQHTSYPSPYVRALSQNVNKSHVLRGQHCSKNYVTINQWDCWILKIDQSDCWIWQRVPLGIEHNVTLLCTILPWPIVTWGAT